MQPNIVIQLDQSIEHDREVIERLVADSLPRIDAYLKKYDEKPDAEVRIEIFIWKNVDNSFGGKFHAHLDGESARFEREKYIKLDDLVHHAFQHLKEQMMGK